MSRPLALMLVLAWACRAFAGHADLVIQNGKIVTLAADMPDHGMSLVRT